MKPVVPFPRQPSWLQSLSVKIKIFRFPTLLSATGGPTWNRHGSNIVLTLLIRLLGVDDTWLRQKLGLSILI